MNSEAEALETCGFVPVLHCGTVACAFCREELEPVEARTHRLRCKGRLISRAFVGGVPVRFPVCAGFRARADELEVPDEPDR
jgi:hypothetical protein